MMDGIDHAGRKISLLNGLASDVARPSLAARSSTSTANSSFRLQRAPLLLHHASSSSCSSDHDLCHHLPPLLAHDTHSRTSSSSNTSTPCLSPLSTPPLVRSASSDSRTSFTSPSPLTPSAHTPSNHSFDHRGTAHDLRHTSPSQKQAHHRLPPLSAEPSPRHKMDDPAVSLYPPIPDVVSGSMVSAYMLPMQIPSQIPPHPDDAIIMPMYRPSNSPGSEPSLVSSVSVASTTTNAANTPAHSAGAKAIPKKNQYPCPMAKQFNCSDFFTTSGHAARHAKKHTGKKDAYCPECNKAFTRKDNMEQHRRTHQTGRSSGRSSDDKVKKPTKTAKKTSITKIEPVLEAAIEQHLAEQQSQLDLIPTLPAPQSIPITQQTIAAAQMQAAAVEAQATAAQLQQRQIALEAALLPAAGPYFINNLDTGPISTLPMPVVPDASVRPPLYRSNMTSSLDYIPPLLGSLDFDPLSYSYPSPGLSHGLHSLALAASARDRLSEDKSPSPPRQVQAGASPLTEPSSAQPTPTPESP